jgi:RHH-type proline utilization regulon transcriptional repressor/proline dehydrogenase/delta 1-pyrroline-5-carboxylate dehydrogenase
MNALPEILKYDFREWSIYYYLEFENILFQDKGVLEPSVIAVFSPFLSGDFNSFRIQVVVKSVSLLMGVFPEEKELRFATFKLNQELFFLGHFKDTEKNFTELKVHTEKIAVLPLKNFPSETEINAVKYDLQDVFAAKNLDELEKENNLLIKRLLRYINEYRPSLFERVSDFGLSLSADYALIRVHLLKFLAILPSLDFDKSGLEVKRILLESLRNFFRENRKAWHEQRKGQNRPLPKFYAFFLTLFYGLAVCLPQKFLAFSVRSIVRFLARRFIAGETIEKASQSLTSLLKSDRDVTLDQLGELVVSEKEANHYLAEVLKLIRGFSLYIKKGEKNAAGILKAHVSIKVSALCSDFRAYAFDYTYGRVAPRLRNILLEGKKHQVFINVDAEHFHYRDLVFKIYKKVLLETPELTGYSGTGIVLQSYLRDSYQHFLDILELAKKRGVSMPVRLVKGAYWDAETIEAKAQSFEAPEFLNKEETDIMCRKLMAKILESSHLQLCLGSHNFSDHCFAETLRKKYYPEALAIEHQCLHMTYEGLSMALAKMGYATRNYVPVGSLLVGMAYLVRRIMENSSQVGVLTIMRSHKNLKNLVSPLDIHQEKKHNNQLETDHTRSEI